MNNILQNHNKIFLNIDSSQREYSIYPNASQFNLDNMLPNILPIKNSNYISLVSANIPVNNTNYIDTINNNNFINIKSVQINLPGGFSPKGLNQPNYINFKIPSFKFNKTNQLIINDPNLNNIYGDLSKYNLNLFDNVIISSTDNNIINILNSINNNLIHMNLSTLINNNINGLYFTYVNNRVTINNNLGNVNYLISFANQIIIHNNYYITLGYLLGFRKLDYQIKFNSSIKAEYDYNIYHAQYIFLRINDYGSYYSNLHNPTKVLAKLYYDSKIQRYIYKNGSNESWEAYKFSQLTDIKKLEIELIDYTGNTYYTDEDYDFTLEIGSSLEPTLFLNTSTNNIIY